jgi:hypothetical protein
VQAGNGIVTVPFPIGRQLTNGAGYIWSLYLAPSGSTDRSQALATYTGGPLVARTVTPTIQIAAVPPLFLPAADATVRVLYDVAEDAVVVVNLLDSQHRWRGGGVMNAGGGGGQLDVPVRVQPGIPTGNYLLEAFLSDSATNRQTAMAKAVNVPVEVADRIQRDTINAIVHPPSIPAGEVFRFVVEFSATTARDLHVDLFDAETNFLAGTVQPVARGSGIRDMTLSYPLAPEGNYFVTAFLTPKDQTWEKAIAWSSDRKIVVVSTAYQQWLESHWGVLLSLDAIGPEADADGDAIDNYSEFLALTNPRDAADFLKVNVGGAVGRWKLTWSSSPGRRYQLFQLTGLNNGRWVPFGNIALGTGAFMEAEIDLRDRATFFRVQVLPGMAPRLGFEN